MVKNEIVVYYLVDKPHWSSLVLLMIPIFIIIFLLLLTMFYSVWIFFSDGEKSVYNHVELIPIGPIDDEVNNIFSKNNANWNYSIVKDHTRKILKNLDNAIKDKDLTENIEYVENLTIEDILSCREKGINTQDCKGKIQYISSNSDSIVKKKSKLRFSKHHLVVRYVGEKGRKYDFIVHYSSDDNKEINGVKFSGVSREFIMYTVKITDPNSVPIEYVFLKYLS